MENAYVLDIDWNTYHGAKNMTKVVSVSATRVLKSSSVNSKTSLAVSEHTNSVTNTNSVFDNILLLIDFLLDHNSFFEQPNIYLNLK